jgi:hypothetical protein
MAPKVTAQIDFGMKTAAQDDRAVPAGVARNKQNPPFSPMFETVDDYAFATLCFTTVMGLVAFIAAMFTTMLSLPDTWRYFCLAICVVTFALSAIGVVLLFQRNRALQRENQNNEVGRSPRP